MSHFVANPSFWPMFESALMRSLTEKAEDIAGVAQRNTRHPTLARGISVEPASRAATGPFSGVKASGLNPIFDKGATNRRTRQGLYRGDLTAERHIERAVDSEVPKGLDLSRYL